MCRWCAALGLVMVGLGSSLFFELPLDGTDSVPVAVDHFAISVGAIIAVVGGGFIMAAFPVNGSDIDDSSDTTPISKQMENDEDPARGMR